MRFIFQLYLVHHASGLQKFCILRFGSKQGRTMQAEPCKRFKIFHGRRPIHKLLVLRKRNQPHVWSWRFGETNLIQPNTLPKGIELRPVVNLRRVYLAGEWEGVVLHARATADIPKHNYCRAPPPPRRRPRHRRRRRPTDPTKSRVGDGKSLPAIICALIGGPNTEARLEFEVVEDYEGVEELNSPAAADEVAEQIGDRR